jgi:hypothetical protein
MKNIYVKPSVKEIIVSMENLMAGSDGVNRSTPTTGLDHMPGNGGKSDGTKSAGSKFNPWIYE